MSEILYVYAIAREIDQSAIASRSSGVEGSSRFGVTGETMKALYSLVPEQQFSQTAIDARASDLDWLSSIGYAHQRVNEVLSEMTTTIPLRAFTLFSSEAALQEYLRSEEETLAARLEALEGKSEWTLRIELEPQRWSDAIVQRVPSLRALSEEAATAGAGKSYLLRKKLEDEKKKAAREAEDALLREVETKLRDEIDAEMIVEPRQRRAGSYPQINLLLKREQSDRLRVLEQALADDYRRDGVQFVVTGPWPAYSFASGERNG